MLTTSTSISDPTSLFASSTTCSAIGQYGQLGDVNTSTLNIFYPPHILKEY
jgi:hypothetical protein